MSEAAHELHLHDPQTLYRHWEESQWSPFEIDLSTDREQRHIGYGVWYLREAVARTPSSADDIRATLRDLLPAVAESLTPPGGADTAALGASAEELRWFALDGLTRRLSIIGVPLDTL